MAAILIVSGSGGPHSLLGVALVRALAEAAFGETSYAHASDIRSFRDAFEARRGEAFVAFLEAPSRDCAFVLQRSRTKVAVFDDAFGDSALFFMEHHGADLASALRHATRGACLTAALVRHDNSDVFQVPPVATLLAHHLRRLALFFGIEPSDRVVEGAFGQLGFAPQDVSAITCGTALVRLFPAFGRIVERLARLPERERGVLERLASGYGTLPGGRPEGPALLWPAELLLLGDRPGEALPDAVALIGPARTLAYGPYLHLPAGGWEAALTLSTGENRSGNRVSIRYAGGGGALRPAAEIELPVQGRLELRTPLTVESAEEPLEMILRLEEGAIEGWVSIEEIALRKQPE